MCIRKGVCRGCASDEELPIFRGQIVSKGHWPTTICTECGTVIEGTPGLLAHVYWCWTGRWPWQEGDT